MSDKKKLLDMLTRKRAAQIGLTPTESNNAAVLMYRSEMTEVEQEALSGEVGQLSKLIGVQKIYLLPRRDLDTVEA